MTSRNSSAQESINLKNGTSGTYFGTSLNSSTVRYSINEHGGRGCLLTLSLVLARVCVGAAKLMMSPCPDPCVHDGVVATVV